uniref:Uncharacterized protein n=1 Tax=Glossina brevipalpis TaxID=37001 RepID=A0A1A9X240_9MUSC
MAVSAGPSKIPILGIFENITKHLKNRKESCHDILVEDIPFRTSIKTVQNMSVLSRASFLRPAILGFPFKGISRWTKAGSAGLIKMKVVPAPKTVWKTYDEKNKDEKRDLSPSLGIYRPQVTSMLSIILRMSGIALGVMFWGLGLFSLISDHQAEELVQYAEDLNLPGWFWALARWFVAFPFAFHYCNGIRHMCFMGGNFLEIGQIYATGYAVFIIATILTVYLAMYNEIENFKVKHREE